jgi:hypothetical protein
MIMKFFKINIRTGISTKKKVISWRWAFQYVCMFVWHIIKLILIVIVVCFEGEVLAPTLNGLCLDFFFSKWVWLWNSNLYCHLPMVYIYIFFKWWRVIWSNPLNCSFRAFFFSFKWTWSVYRWILFFWKRLWLSMATTEGWRFTKMHFNHNHVTSTITVNII